MEKGRRQKRKMVKTEKRKKENEKCKEKNVWKKGEKLMNFFLSLSSLLGNEWNFFGVYQNGNFDQENAKITPGKNQEKWLCPPPPHQN